MRFRLNLATNPLQTHRRFYVAVYVAGTFAGLALLVLSWHVYEVRRSNEIVRVQIAQLRQDLERLSAQRQEMEAFFARPENARLNDRATYLNSLIDSRSFNWTEMFMDLEKLLPAGVRVVSIAPSLQREGVSVKLTVNANNAESEVKFLQALETSKVFSGIEVISAHTPNRNEAGAEVVVELTAWYLRT
jgi:Tfp pilus assembly protein PilN